MIRVEVVVDESALTEVQALLDAPTPSEAVRILISNRLATERAKRDERRRTRRADVPPPEPAPDFPRRASGDEDWKARRETHGDRRWRKAGPVVDEPESGGRNEHPIRAYQRRVEEEEQGKQRARRGGALGRSGERPPRSGRPGGPTNASGPDGSGHAPGNRRPTGGGRPGGGFGGGRPGGPGGGRAGGPGGGRPGGPGGGRPGGSRPPRNPR